MTEEWRVWRGDRTAVRTIGELWFGDLPTRACHTLEDPVRPVGVKVAKHTAIHEGRFRVRLTWSDRFGWLTPQVLNVPMFEGIRFHGGERPDDTEGCPLVGLVRTVDEIHNCPPAKKIVCERLLAAERNGIEVWCTFTNATRPTGPI